MRIALVIGCKLEDSFSSEPARYALRNRNRAPTTSTKVAGAVVWWVLHVIKWRRLCHKNQRVGLKLLPSYCYHWKYTFAQLLLPLEIYTATIGNIYSSAMQWLSLQLSVSLTETSAVEVLW